MFVYSVCRNPTIQQQSQGQDVVTMCLEWGRSESYRSRDPGERLACWRGHHPERLWDLCLEWKTEQEAKDVSGCEVVY